MTEKEKMEQGMVYRYNDPEILAEQKKTQRRIRRYNAKTPRSERRRQKSLEKMFRSVGARCVVEAPFYANWGASHVSLGSDVYINYGLTLVDDGWITVGDRTMIGPGVTIATASHPIDPAQRAVSAQYNRNVAIGEDVWIGAGVIVLPGVTIGDRCVIGAGSVVTRDVPSGSVAYGNPCRVRRDIEENTIRGGGRVGSENKKEQNHEHDVQ